MIFGDQPKCLNISQVEMFETTSNQLGLFPAFFSKARESQEACIISFHYFSQFRQKCFACVFWWTPCVWPMLHCRPEEQSTVYLFWSSGCKLHGGDDRRSFFLGILYNNV